MTIKELSLFAQYKGQNGPHVIVSTPRDEDLSALFKVFTGNADIHDLALPKLYDIVEGERKICLPNIDKLNDIRIAALADILDSYYDVAKLYKDEHKCPLCGADSDKLIRLKPRTLQHTPSIADSSLSYQVEPCFCKACGLGFNYRGHSLEVFDTLNTKSTVFYSGKNTTDKGQTSAFANWLKFADKYAKNHDARVLEIGSFDGALISDLISHGYKNVLGYEPGSLFDKSLPIINDYFTKDSVGKDFEAQSFDLVLCNNTIECIPDLQGAVCAMSDALKSGGALIMEIPSPLAVNSFQLYRMGLSVLSSLYRKAGVIAVERYPLKNPICYNDHNMLIGIKGTEDEVRVLGYTPLDLDVKSELKEIIESFTTGGMSKDLVESTKASIESAKRDNKRVVVYGSGLVARRILSAVAPHLDDETRSIIEIVDSDESREGGELVTNDKYSFKVRFADRALQDSTVGLMIFGVARELFYKQIKERLAKLNCSYDSELYLPHLFF